MFRGFAVALVAALSAWAAGPENVMVVANRKSEVSGRIARYYAQKRGLTEKQICWLDAPAQETVDRAAFEAVIEKPVRQCLVSRGLTEQILFLVMTKGVAIRVSGGGKGLAMEAASTDSELALLYAKIHGQSAPVAGPVANPYFKQGQSPFRHPAFAMYLVTRLDGYDFAAAQALVDRALAADKAPAKAGKVYLDMREGSDVTGEDWLRDAAVLLPAGRSLLEQSGNPLYGQKNAIGYASWGSNDTNHKERRPNYQWLPGGLATEYVSTSARTFERPPEKWRVGTWGRQDTWFAGSPQTMSADLVEDGATGVSGHVDEPYLAFTPRPDLLFPAYFSGRNLAEAFYASIPALSWMNIVLGDPLCKIQP